MKSSMTKWMLRRKACEFGFAGNFFHLFNFICANRNTKIFDCQFYLKLFLKHFKTINSIKPFFSNVSERSMIHWIIDPVHLQVHHFLRKWCVLDPRTPGANELTQRNTVIPSLLCQLLAETFWHDKWKVLCTLDSLSRASKLRWFLLFYIKFFIKSQFKSNNLSQ